MSKSIREAYGDAICELGKTNEKIVVFDADLAHATQTIKFKQMFPDRFYDLGIAENNLMGTAAAFAREGFIPFASTFAIFGAGRAYEIIRNSIAYTNLNVKIALTHAGLSVGEDGGSHQSIEDIALMRVLPNMTVLVPCDPIETKKIIEASININGPVYIRLARPECENITEENKKFEVGKAEILKQGKDICIIACGLMVKEAMDAQNFLEKENICVTVVNMHTIKPIDKKLLLDINKNYKLIISCEEHSIIGGLGSAIAEVISEEPKAVLKMIGIKDKFGHSGKPNELFKEYGITSTDIIKLIKETKI